MLYLQACKEGVIIVRKALGGAQFLQLEHGMPDSVDVVNVEKTKLAVLVVVGRLIAFAKDSITPRSLVGARI
jgi:hypothetical protein